MDSFSKQNKYLSEKQNFLSKPNANVVSGKVREVTRSNKVLFPYPVVCSLLLIEN